MLSVEPCLAESRRGFERRRKMVSGSQVAFIRPWLSRHGSKLRAEQSKSHENQSCDSRIDATLITSWRG